MSAKSISRSYGTLKRRITDLVLNYRKSTFSCKDSQRPRFVKDDVYYDGRVAFHRRVIILTSNGCSVPTCSMCPFTNYNFYANPEKRSNPDPSEQLRISLEESPKDKVELLALYNDGSFFSTNEISIESRNAIADIVRKAEFPMLMVESLPQFINEDHLKAFCKRLGQTRLVIGIGLQSANEFVREICVNSSVNRKQFEKSVYAAQRCGVKLKPYVLIKPPFLSESEAFMDVIETAKYLASIGVSNMTLCPVRIAENTLAHYLKVQGLYKVPDLWTVYASLRESLKLLDVRIASLNLTSEDFESLTSTTESIFEYSSLMQAILKYTHTGTLEALQLSAELEKLYIDKLDKLHSKSEDRLAEWVTYCIDRLVSD